MYDQAKHSSFYLKLESIQYNDALEIIGAIRGTSKEKLSSVGPWVTSTKRVV